MSIFDWADTITAIERPPLAAVLTEVYGPDLAAQVIGDVAAEIAELRRRAEGCEPDGVWEEGYTDALHDVLQRICGPEHAAIDCGFLSLPVDVQTALITPEVKS